MIVRSECIGGTKIVDTKAKVVKMCDMKCYIAVKVFEMFNPVTVLFKNAKI